MHSMEFSIQNRLQICWCVVKLYNIMYLISNYNDAMDEVLL